MIASRICPASELFQIVAQYINQNYDSVSKLAKDADHSQQQGVEIQDKSMELLHSLQSAESAIEKARQAQSVKKSVTEDVADRSVEAGVDEGDVKEEEEDKPVNEPINEPVNEPVNEPIHEPIHEPINTPTNAPTTPANETPKTPTTYHVTANLDPSTLLQHAADQAQLPLSSEDADRLVEAMTPSPDETEELSGASSTRKGSSAAPSPPAPCARGGTTDT